MIQIAEFVNGELLAIKGKGKTRSNKVLIKTEIGPK